LVTVLFLSANTYACESDDSETYKLQVWAELRDKKDWCIDEGERALPVFINFPEIYDDFKVNQEITLIISSEHVELFTVLTRASHLGGVSFCINQELLQHTKVLISYGYNECKVPERGFTFINLERLLERERVYPK